MDTSANQTIASMSPGDMEEILAFLKSWGWHQILLLATFILGQTLGNVMVTYLIWYETYGGMDQYKTVLNQLIAHCCMFVLICKYPNMISNSIRDVIYAKNLSDSAIGSPCFLYMILTTEAPSLLFCDFLFVVSDIFLMIMLLEFTFSAALRYTFLFIWKQVHGLNDDFVSRFLTMSAILSCTVLEYVNVAFGYHRGTMWFICSGGASNPFVTDNFRRPDQITFGILAFMLFFFVHGAFAVRLAAQKLKMKCRRSVFCLGH